jgi:hypothetical protein
MDKQTQPKLSVLDRYYTRADTKRELFYRKDLRDASDLGNGSFQKRKHTMD